MKEKIDLEMEINRAGIHKGLPALPDPIIYTVTKQRPVSLLALAGRKIISPLDQNPVSDAYKILRTQLIHRMRENGWNTVGITSPREGEGKSLTAANLAVSFSTLSNQTVLLIDADFKKPKVHQLFGLDEKGLVNFLLDEEPVEELLVNPGINKLTLLPVGRKVLNSSDLLISSRMLQLVKEVKHRYRERVVLFDLPPLLPSADVLAFSPHLDALLLVLESGKTQEKDLKKAIEMLKGVPIVGTVLNKT